MNTAIASAAQRGDLDSVIKCYRTNPRGADWALIMAAGNGHTHVVDWLDGQGEKMGRTKDMALQWACYEGHAHAVRWLVEHGANVALKDYYSVKCAAENVGVLVALVDLGVPLRYAMECPKFRTFLKMCEKNAIKTRERAVIMIQRRWIPICYDTSRDSGKNMLQNAASSYMRDYKP